MADSRDTFTTEIYVNNQQANDAIAEMTKQLTKLTDKYNDLTAKNEKLVEKTDKAKSAMEETAKALAGMTKGTEEYVQTSKKLKDQEKAYNELARQLEVNKHKMEAVEKEMNSTKESIERAENGVEKYKEALDNLSGKSMQNLVKMQRKLKSELDKTKPNTKDWEKLAAEYHQVTAEIKRLESAQEAVVMKQEGFFRRMGKGLSNYFGALMVAYTTIKRLANAFINAYKTISNFEQANANLGSILGATGEQMEKLERTAMQLGSTTRYTATEVTSLQTELAKLGFTVKEITDMAPSVLNFAGSVGTDLASAAALAGVALRTFNLRSEKTEDVLGTMAVACNKSALSFAYLQNSFSTIAPVAKTYGLSLKDTVALLGTLANAGFDASSAATAMRNILLNLANTNGKLAKALGGSVNSFEDILDAMIKLRDQGANLNETLQLTDKRSVSAFNAFLDGAEKAKALRGELENVNGELQRMAEERANTVEGAIAGMKSAWEGFVLTFRSSKGFIKNVLDGIAASIRGVTRAIDPEAAVRNDVSKWFGEARRSSKDAADAADKLQAKYDQLMNTYSKLGGKTGEMYRNAIKEVFDEEMAAIENDAAAINEKIQQVNAKYAQQEQEIYSKRAKLLEKNSKAAGSKEWKRLEAQLAANRKAWDKALDDARNFREEMDEILSGGDEEVDEKEQAKLQAAYNKKKAQLTAWLNYSEKLEKAKMMQGEISEAEYNQRVFEHKKKFYESLLSLGRQYQQNDTSIANQILDEHIKALEEEKKRVKEEMEEMMKVYVTEHPDQNISDEDYNRLSNERRRQGYKEAGVAGEGEDLDKNIDAYEKFQEKLWKKAADIRAAITEDSARTVYETEMAWAEKLAKDGVITVEEAEKYKMKIRLEYAAKVAQKVGEYAEMASNFVTALKEAESAKLEAQYQADLTAAGDNAEKREEVEAEYEQKQLELKKKYADTEMVIKIAKTTASGAAAAVKAWEDGGPYAGPALAALTAATTAAEIATIVAQRNAIKNTSVNSSSSSSIETGKRTMTGYGEGGYTEISASDRKVAGVVHTNEWVGPAWMVRRNPTVFANLERYRLAHSHVRSGSFSNGFAEGGYTGSGNGTMSVLSRPERRDGNNADIGAVVRTAVVDAFESGAVRVVLVRQDLTELDAQDAKFKKQTSRG